MQFADDVRKRLPFRVHVIQTDNGAEFQSLFHWHLEAHDIRHVYIRPHTPRLNGKVERSHRVDDQEFYQLLDKRGITDDIRLFNEKLREWEDYYNYHRPHGALNGQTPYERLLAKKNAAVLPKSKTLQADLPETKVTLHTGHMGDTLPCKGRVSCHGRSVGSWTIASGLLPGCSTARRWRRCARNSASRARPATRVFERCSDSGVQGLTDRSRRPYRHANQLPLTIEKWILRLKREYPHWGAPKIRERLRQRCPDVQCPAISTVHAVLDRHGLVTPRGRARRRAQGTPLSQPAQRE